jgi:hypothetical protein
LLNSTKSANGERIIKYKKQFMNHNYKFSLAIKELPEECFIIKPGTYSRRSFSRKSFNVAILAAIRIVRMVCGYVVTRTDFNITSRYTITTMTTTVIVNNRKTTKKS